MKTIIIIITTIFFIIGCNIPADYQVQKLKSSLENNGSDYPPDVFTDDGLTVTENDSYGNVVNDVIFVLGLFGYSEEADMIKDSLKSGEIKIKDLDNAKGEVDLTTDDIYIDPAVFPKPDHDIDLTDPKHIARLFKIAAVMIHEIFHTKNQGGVYLWLSSFFRTCSLNITGDFGEFYAWEFHMNFLDNVIQLMLDNAGKVKKCEDKFTYLQIASSLLSEKKLQAETFRSKKYGPMSMREIWDVKELKHMDELVFETLLEVAKECDKKETSSIDVEPVGSYHRNFENDVFKKIDYAKEQMGTQSEVFKSSVKEFAGYAAQFPAAIFEVSLNDNMIIGVTVELDIPSEIFVTGYTYDILVQYGGTTWGSNVYEGYNRDKVDYVLTISQSGLSKIICKYGADASIIQNLHSSKYFTLEYVGYNKEHNKTN